MAASNRFDMSSESEVEDESMKIPTTVTDENQKRINQYFEKKVADQGSSSYVNHQTTIRKYFKKHEKKTSTTQTTFKKVTKTVLTIDRHESAAHFRDRDPISTTATGSASSGADDGQGVRDHDVGQPDRLVVKSFFVNPKAKSKAKAKNSQACVFIDGPVDLPENDEYLQPSQQVQQHDHHYRQVDRFGRSKSPMSKGSSRPRLNRLNRLSTGSWEMMSPSESSDEFELSQGSLSTLPMSASPATAALNRQPESETEPDRAARAA